VIELAAARHTPWAANGKIEGSVQWWLGDWWAFGEHLYGDRKAIVEAESWEGPANKTNLSSPRLTSYDRAWQATTDCGFA
jgi:hypothetical protein